MKIRTNSGQVHPLEDKSSTKIKAKLHPVRDKINIFKILLNNFKIFWLIDYTKSTENTQNAPSQ